VNAFKATVRLSAEKAFGNSSTILGPVKLEIVFVMPRPKNQFWKSKPMPRTRHTKKPDIDNLLKSVADALTGLLWLDDAQISECTAKKMVASGDEQPHVVVRVEEVSD
jgi:Holliday junction resolvase RusA-like endonuclease